MRNSKNNTFLIIKFEDLSDYEKSVANIVKLSLHFSITGPKKNSILKTCRIGGINSSCLKRCRLRILI